MQIIREKEIPEGERARLVSQILIMFEEKGYSFRQAEEILSVAQDKLKSLPIAKRLSLSESLDC